MKTRTLAVFANVLVCFALVLSPLALPAHAEQNATFTVTASTDVVDATPGDGVCETAAGNGMCTLRAAIMEANALIGSDTIILPAAEYNLALTDEPEDESASGDLDITESVTITGAGSMDTVIDASAVGDRVLTVFHTDDTVTITGVKIKSGNSLNYPGGGIANYSDLTLEDVYFYLNQTAMDGGGIWNQNSLTLSDVSFYKNSAGMQGGGAYSQSPIIGNDVYFGSNTSQEEGGGLYATSSSNVQLVSADFNSNTTPSDGGNIYSAGELTLEDSLIRNGDAGNAGGGIFVAQDAISTLTNVSLSGNQAVMIGGAVYIAPNGGLVGDNLVFIHNSTDHYGGALYIYQAEVQLSRCRFQENSAEYGGAINTSDLSSTTIEETTIISNTAVGAGGGIVNTGNMTLRGVTINENRAQFGGGVYNTKVFLIENGTISGNSAKEEGGGMFVAGGDAASIYVYNATITENTAGTDLLHPGGTGGGVYVDEGSSAEVRNTILSGNDHRQLTIFVDDDCNGTLVSGDYNLFGTLSGCTLAAPPGHDLTGEDPLLGELEDNGGPTQTHALLEGSPATDGGNPEGCLGINGVLLTHDQRGVARPMDGDRDGTPHCDIGAYELSQNVTMYLPLLVK